MSKIKIDLNDLVLREIITEKHKTIINNLETNDNYRIKTEFYLDDLTNNKIIGIKLIGLYYEVEYVFSIMEILLAKFDILSQFIEDRIEELKYKDDLFIKGQEDIYYD